MPSAGPATGHFAGKRDNELSAALGRKAKRRASLIRDHLLWGHVAMEGRQLVMLLTASADCCVSSPISAVSEARHLVHIAHNCANVALHGSRGACSRVSLSRGEATGLVLLLMRLRRIILEPPVCPLGKPVGRAVRGGMLPTPDMPAASDVQGG